MRLAPSAAALCLLASALLLAACGYTTRRLEVLPGMRTIAVLPVENTTFRRDLGLRLTQAVADEIRAGTSLALATPAQADAILRMRMTAGEQVVLQRGDRRVLLQRLRGTVTVTVTDRRSGAVLRTFDVHAVEEFEPQPRDEALQGPATEGWIRRVATRIASGLEPGLAPARGR